MEAIRLQGYIGDVCGLTGVLRFVWFSYGSSYYRGLNNYQYYQRFHIPYIIMVYGTLI